MVEKVFCPLLAEEYTDDCMTSPSLALYLLFLINTNFEVHHRANTGTMAVAENYNI